MQISHLVSWKDDHMMSVFAVMKELFMLSALGVIICTLFVIVAVHTTN